MITPDRDIVVFEKRPCWGPELKRQARGGRIQVHESRALERDAAVGANATILVISVDAAPEECLGWLASGPREWPTIAIVSKELAGLEWPLREAGVATVVDDEIRGDRLMQWCLRLFRISSSATSAGLVAGSPRR